MTSTWTSETSRSKSTALLDDEFVSLHEAGRRVGLSYRQVFYRVHAYGVPSTVIGKSRVIRLSDLAAVRLAHPGYHRSRGR
jgi:hypothetical protein